MSKILGIIYLVVNFLIFLALLALALKGSGKYLSFYPSWFVLIVPAVGMLSGYWISSGKYNSKCFPLILFSLFITFATIFVSLVILPLIER